MLSNEEVIKRVEAMWVEHAYPTRNMMRKKIGCSEQRLEAMAKQGLIKYPARVPRNKCHLFSNQDKWRSFKLKGSPKGESNGRQS